jgi:hypothetical protein
MYVRLNRHATGHAYLQIVRSFREAGKVKQDVVFTLGRLDVLQETGQLDNIVAALGRYATRQTWIDLSKDVSIEQVYHLGAAHVVNRMLERLGLKKMLERLAAKHPRMKLPWTTILTGMIVSRFIEPCSKRRLNLEQWGRIYPGILEMDAPPLKGFYRAMDVLWKHREEVETTLFERGGQRDLFNHELDVVFFDLTTLYFESTNNKEGELRRFGYSKEHRNDCTQVMLGLLVDKDGVPVGYHLFPGNTYEPHSLPVILEKLKSKYHIARVIVVADRGLITEKNVGELRQASIDFILGMKLWTMTQARQEAVLDKSQYRAVDKDGTVLVREAEHKGERLVLTWSRKRAERDAQLREKVLERLRTQLARPTTAKQFVTNKGYRQYLKGLDGGTPTLDEQAVAESQKRDGFFGVLTSVAKEAMSGEDVFARYHELWHVEDAFGEIKGPLETRPMFHWVDPRIQSHVLLCLLAYYVEAVITRELRKAKTGLTAGAWFRALNEVYAIPVDARGTRAWVRNEIRGVAAEGYEVLGLKIPDRVLKIEKTQNNEESGGSVVAKNLGAQEVSA